MDAGATSSIVVLVRLVIAINDAAREVKAQIDEAVILNERITCLKDRLMQRAAQNPAFENAARKLLVDIRDFLQSLPQKKQTTLMFNSKSTKSKFEQFDKRLNNLMSDIDFCSKSGINGNESSTAESEQDRQACLRLLRMIIAGGSEQVHCCSSAEPVQIDMLLCARCSMQSFACVHCPIAFAADSCSLIDTASLLIDPLLLHLCPCTQERNMLTQNTLGNKTSANEAIITAMTKHVNDSSVQLWGCRAVSAIAKTDENITKLGAAGACAVVVQALKRHHVSSAELSQWACRAMFSLASTAGNKAKLGDVGACEIVSAVLQTHVNNAEVARMGCGAVASLAVNDANRMALGDAGACQAVVAAAVAHVDEPQMVHYVCSAVQNLACGNDSNQLKLGNAGACSVVVSTLSHHATVSAEAIESACTAAYSLACSNSSNRARLVRGGANALIELAVQTHVGNDKLKQSAQKVLLLLAAVSPPSSPRAAAVVAQAAVTTPANAVAIAAAAATTTTARTAPAAVTVPAKVVAVTTPAAVTAPAKAVAVTAAVTAPAKAVAVAVTAPAAEATATSAQPSAAVSTGMYTTLLGIRQI
jgi:hypothetical protein